MLYIRKIFTQDLRDGKQIAFPKEPSLLFFNFDYKVDDIADRTIRFIYDCIDNNSMEYNGRTIDTRLYAASSESRIDGQLKAFLRDELKVSVDDLVLFKNIGTKYEKFNFSIVRKTDPKYEEFCTLLFSANHVVMYADNSHDNDVTISMYRPYITAIKSKPFLLLAGISGTGKSRIVRELARACWDEGTEEYNAQKPKNFQMVQVKPNWHDSSDLIGYVSRVSGKAEYVAGDFLRFVAKAWEDEDTPYFLCLDEMNLAPVEQYFA